ncbi:MAG: tRNA (guanosine(46)-N7)-methyltransferase TrmB [Pseudomonadota bacterium]
MSSPEQKPLRTFGRRAGRPLSAKQQNLIENLLPTLAVPMSEPGALDPRTLFSGVEEVWFEIGFGGGEHLIAQAAKHPDVGFIGCEPFVDGMAKSLTGIEAEGLANVRLHMDDARDVLGRLSPGCLSRVFILFPDPWPKRRQQKRRLLQPAFLKALSRVLSGGARIRFATDVRSYADDALCVFLEDGRFEWAAAQASDWRDAPEDHILTRYEAKRLGDIDPVWFDFVFKAG